MSRLTDLSKIGISLVIFALVTLASATLARADTVTLVLNTGSTLPSKHFATITLPTNGSGGIVGNTQVDPRNRILHSGVDGSCAFNSTTGSQIGVTGLPGTYSLVNSGNPSSIGMDGFGTFQYGILFGPNGGGAGTDSSLTFTLT